ncbi:hypothetical protein IPC325_06885 [Pseudomonas aeruginosa]|uniref:hypothetical protein n=1 Tax=Pseudomonas aeruginosa TaxID=287 RepID=UPI000FC40E76|nr:hypothetical protein [Pseudomonas aeruginosa]MUI05651.1 hypothetical protein [Pseudomonas aeruginosa]RUJ84165.1 hypothetical protein IPC325_06885 [Pseudomonas aeruginosa]
MNRSYIVHGPTGCGKTRNAERMAAALGLTKVQDNWSPMDQVFEPFDTLYLTASEGPWPDQARHVLSFAEAMGRVPDAVVEPKSRYIHRNGVEYEVVMIANGESTSPKYPPTIVYRGVANGKVWARPACDWDRSMQLVERPASAKVEGTEQVSSTWLAQLRSEYRQFAEADEKMQSTLARVAELERALQTVVNAADHGSWPTTVMHGIEVAREVLAGPSAQTQPSPAPTLRAAIDVANDRFEVPVAKWGTDLAEAERPEVVGSAWRNIYNNGFDHVAPFPPAPGGPVVDEPLMTVAQHERIVGDLQRQKHEADTALAWATRHYQTVEQERDAALARVAGLEHSQSFQRDIDYSVLSEYADKHRLHFNNLCAVVRSALIALPAQAQHSVPDDDTILQIFADNAEHSERGGEHGYCIVREQHALKIARELFVAAPASSEES